VKNPDAARKRTYSREGMWVAYEPRP